MAKIIGIDLGTTNSVVSFMEGTTAKVIPNQEGASTTPSIVAYTKDGARLVGGAAKRQAVTNPEKTIYSAKRFIGRKLASITEDERKMFPYKLVSGKNGDVAFEIDSKVVSPQEIASAVLGKLKKAAEEYLGEKVTQAVVTVPAYFNDAQRQATKDAGQIAGLEVKRIINEPTAAALAYGMDKKASEAIAVFDFGGGTFDVSILEVGDTVEVDGKEVDVVEVQSTNGDTQLGGDNVDEKIIKFLAGEFKNEHGLDITNDKMALQRLKEAAEKAKFELSAANETEINLPYLTADATGPKHLVTKLTRAKFEALCADLFEKLFIPCKQALKDAGLSTSDIKEVILVGGSTRIPKVQEMVKDFFGKEPNKSVNPDEVVSAGAAIQGGVLSGNGMDIQLLDVTPLSLGIETAGEISTTIIEKNTTIPTKKSQVFSTYQDNQPAVDIHVVQGERKFARDNKTLGKFNLDGIKAAPRGVPQIEVTFDIDANGIITVSAKDKGTNKEHNITISNSSGLSKEEVEKLVQEAKEHEAEDKKRLEAVEAKNRLDSIVAQVEKNLKEHEAQLSADDKTAITAAIDEAKATLKDKSEDKEALDKAGEELLKKSEALGKLVQAAEQAKQQAEKSGEPAPEQTATAEEAPKKDGAVDADFEEV